MRAAILICLMLLSLGAVATVEGCACTKEYEPVCGDDGETYSNSCEAGCAGTTVKSEGPC